MSGGGYAVVDSALAVKRTQSSWNDWLAQAEKPASPTEEMKIERAASMVTGIVSANDWLVNQGVRVAPQGSYHNNTNVRREADMDLRLEFTQVLTINNHGGNIDTSSWPELGLVAADQSFEFVNRQARHHLTLDLIRRFGVNNVNASSKKAIKVSGLDGSRADCDIVPTFKLVVFERANNGALAKTEGVAILGTDGSWTYNYPEQHYANGVRKRENTSHRFKRIVRMLKRLNYELEAFGEILKRLPSFFIECLVYRVEDEYFLVEDQDRYFRLLVILYRLHYLLQDKGWCDDAKEISDFKWLFRPSQPWTAFDAQLFVLAAIRRLEA